MEAQIRKTKMLSVSPSSVKRKRNKNLLPREVVLDLVTMHELSEV